MKLLKTKTMKKLSNTTRKL